MNVTIRRAQERDRRYHDWQEYSGDATGWYRSKPWVVTVDGRVYLVLELHGRLGEVVHVQWQNGSEQVPNLLRMFKRFLDTLPALYDDVRSLKREEEHQRVMRDYRETVARAMATTKQTREEAG